MGSATRIALALAGIACGCTGTETGNPPLTDPPRVNEDAVELDFSLATVDSTTIMAGPGTVEPPGGTVVIFELDTDAPPYEGPVAMDGSFEVDILTEFGTEIRIEVVQEGVRAAPIDRIVDMGLPPVTHALGHCLTTTPESQLTLETGGAVGEVRVQNGCGEPVSLSAPRLRRAVTTFALEGESAQELLPGDEAVVRVRALDALTSAEVLLLDATAPSADRRAITLAH